LLYLSGGVSVRRQAAQLVAMLPNRDRKVPDAKTLVRLGQVIGPETIAELHARFVALAFPGAK